MCCEAKMLEAANNQGSTPTDVLLAKKVLNHGCTRHLYGTDGMRPL